MTLIAKGLPAETLRSAHTAPNELLRDLQTKNTQQIRRIKPRLPKAGASKVATLTLGVECPLAAQKLIKDGLLWRAQLFTCEPFHPEAEPKRCYKCHGWGHIGRFCKAAARCGYCGAAAHDKGEDACPQKKPGGVAYCKNCDTDGKGGEHPAWDRRCPEAKRQKAKAQEAYSHRPRQLRVQGQNQQQQTHTQTFRGPWAP